MQSTLSKLIVALAIVVAFVAGGFLATKLGDDKTTTDGTDETTDSTDGSDGTEAAAGNDAGTVENPDDPGATSTDPVDPEGTGLQTIPGTLTEVATPVSSQDLLLRSMGPLVVGMTVREAQDAIGGSIINETNSGGSCNFGTVHGDPDSPGLMIISQDGATWEDSRIERIDLTPASETRSGIRIGSSTDDVYTAYGEAIVATPHPYDNSPGAFYLTYVPTDPSDADYRLIMETSGDVVTELRTGFRSTVEQTGGCQ